MTELTISAIPGIRDITPGDDLAGILADAISLHIGGLKDSDVLVVAQKIVSKADGLLVRLDDVEPSTEARELSARLSKDPRYVEVVLRESRRVVRSFRHPAQTEGTIICEHVSGHIAANAGVDRSNLGESDMVLTLPRDPDASASAVHARIRQRFPCRFGLVITDTFGRPWRNGQLNVAIGVAGMPAMKSDIGSLDGHGRELTVTAPAFADEIAAASGLVIGKASRTPLVLIRGLSWDGDAGRASNLIRADSEDMFR